MPTIHIDDPADQRLTDYRELRDVRARRAIEGDEFFIAEGPVAIARLLDSGHRARSVLVSESKLHRLAPIVAALEAPVFVVSSAALRTIVGFDLHRGIIAAADRQPLPTPAELIDTADRVAVIEGVNDPENIGLIMRSASALYVDAVLLDPTCIDPYTRRSVRVSMGESLHVPFARVTSQDWPDHTIAMLTAAGFETWALTPAVDSIELWSLSVPNRLAMIFGAEGPGLSRATMVGATRRVSIPIREGVDSLNVAAAAAVTFAIANR